MVTPDAHQIEVIPTSASRVKQICRRIFPDNDITITTPIGEPLSYGAFNRVTPWVFSTLKGTYDDILLTEKTCIEVVQRTSSATEIDDQIWQVILELPDELFQLHVCYEVLKLDQQRLLNFLPNRMWCNGIKHFLPLPVHRRTGILDTFLKRCQDHPLKSWNCCS